MAPLRVLVSGASIAGPTAAYWLARAGATVTVIERFPSLRPGGQNVDIRSVGVTVMRKMAGVEEAVKAKLYDVEGFGMVDIQGRPVAVFRASGDPDAQNMLSEYEIFRGDLAKILHDASVEQGATYIFSETISSIQSQRGTDGPVRVEFSSGRPSEEYDLVVAADGATSRTRAIGLNCGVRDHVHSMNMYIAWWTTPKDMLNGNRVGTAWSSPPGRSCGIGPMKGDQSKGVLFRVFPKGNSDALKQFLHATEQAKENVTAQRDHIVKEFAGAGYRAPELLDTLVESKDFYASEMVQVKVPCLYKGRFALVGDAGHAAGPTGVGTSLAMTSGYVLAGELLQANGDVAAGLKAFEERMRPIITDMQRLPPGVPALMAPQTHLVVWLRNKVFSLLALLAPYGKYLSWISGLMSSAFSSPEKHRLPDYKWER